jgi:hypothetical protein
LETAEAKAERIIAEELGRLNWRELIGLDGNAVKP